ncbi:MAG: DNA-processing protein DprA [Mycobacteriaceae bacterium]
MSTVESKILQSWAYLSAVAEGPCSELLDFISQVGPVEATERIKRRDISSEILLRRTAARSGKDFSQQHLSIIDKLGGRFLTPDDEQWPAWRFLAFDGVLARESEQCRRPVALWVLGSGNVVDATDFSVSVVGTRAVSGYGEHVAADFSSELSTAGMSIVSGAAYGVDGVAHRAALGVGGTTIAVLACGVDQAYPAAHSALLHRISQNGLVISEYVPGTRPARHRFLARNRLVAALSDAVIVIEAGSRSGAANTAAWARRLGKAVCAVPGPVTAPSSVGCHRLIQEGARLVTSAAEVMEEAGRIGDLAPSPPRSKTKLDNLSEEQRWVYEALPLSGAAIPAFISQESAVPIAQVRAALPMLEMFGLAINSMNGWQRCDQVGDKQR